MVRTKQGEVGQLVRSSPAQPAHVVRFAQVASVRLPRPPAAELADAVVQVAKFQHQLAVTLDRLSGEVGPAFGGEARGFLLQKACDSLVIPEYIRASNASSGTSRARGSDRSARA